MGAAHGSGEAQVPPARWAGSDVLIDLERNGEWNFVKELIDTFLKDAALRIGSMRKAALTADMTALACCSHTLKGSALVMNALSLAELSTQIERYAELNERRDYLSLIDGLDLALSEVCQAMTSYEQSLPQDQSAWAHANHVWRQLLSGEPVAAADTTEVAGEAAAASKERM